MRKMRADEAAAALFSAQEKLTHCYCIGCKMRHDGYFVHFPSSGVLPILGRAKDTPLKALKSNTSPPPSRLPNSPHLRARLLRSPTFTRLATSFPNLEALEQFVDEVFLEYSTNKKKGSFSTIQIDPKQRCVLLLILCFQRWQKSLIIPAILNSIPSQHQHGKHLARLPMILLLFHVQPSAKALAVEQGRRLVAALQHRTGATITKTADIRKPHLMTLATNSASPFLQRQTGPN